jgi:hypothetical protein
MESKNMVLTKTKPWIVASLLVATSAVFGQQDNKNCQPKPKDCCVKTCPATLQAPTVAAYNAPARIDTRCSWDVWVDASFTYWQPIQDNMEFALVTSNTAATPSPSVNGFAGNAVQQGFSYKPGFKVGGGWSAGKHDNWDFASEYTWFRGNNSTKTNGSSTNTGSGIYSLVGVPGYAYGTANSLNSSTQVYNTATSKWRLGMDLVDANMGRWSYVGTDLKVRSYIGARGAWIRQYRKATFVNDGSTGSSSGTQGTYTVRDSSHSWGVGPEVGMNSKWNIGEGFRFEGDAQADILYTQYTSIYHTEAGSVTLQSGYNYNTHEHKMGTLRTHLDLELGIAWGSYFDNNNWYIDLAASYGFQVFFNQNVFRTLAPSEWSRPTLGNLYVQGLTVTARLDF